MKKSRLIWLGTGVLILAGAWMPFAVKRKFEMRRLEQKLPASRFPFPELAALDRQIQARLAVVPTNSFGLNRIGARHEYFKAESAEEARVLRAVRASGWQVVFFIAGRSYLAHKPTSGASPPWLQGPVFITSKDPLRMVATQSTSTYVHGSSVQPVLLHSERVPKDLPREKELSQPLDGMLTSKSRWDHTDTPELRQFKSGNWDVLAVPVRASDWTCVSCHSWNTRSSPPRLGDPVGVALYAYRPIKGASKVEVPLRGWRGQNTDDSFRER